MNEPRCPECYRAFTRDYAEWIPIHGRDLNDYGWVVCDGSGKMPVETRGDKCDQCEHSMVISHHPMGEGFIANCRHCGHQEDVTR